MVYFGKRSSGCALCRQRKVKCDEQKPGCRRCETYFAQCPGYEKPLLFRFHSENHSYPNTKKSGTPMAKSQHGELSDLTTTLSEFVRAHPKNGRAESNEKWHNLFSTAISYNIQQPQSSWDERSICYFLQQYYVEPLPGMVTGHLDFLLNQYSSSSPTSCLRPATLAAAYLSYSRHCSSEYFYLEARKYYGKALRAVNNSVFSSQSQTRDEIFSAVMLLSLFEDIDGEGIISRSSHIMGIAQLLQSQGRKLLFDLPAGSLYHWMFIHLAIYALNTGQSLACLSIPTPEPSNQFPLNGTMILVAKICHFCGVASKSVLDLGKEENSSQNSRDVLLRTIHQAMSIQAELDRCHGLLPPIWKPQTIIGEDGTCLVVFSTRWIASIWCLYNACLSFFYSHVLLCCRTMLSSQFSKSSEELSLLYETSKCAKSNIEQLIGVICGSIPYLFGEYDGQGRLCASSECKTGVFYNMIWPLAVVSTCHFSTDDQVQLSKDSLKRIGQTYGLRLAHTVETLVNFL